MAVTRRIHWFSPVPSARSGIAEIAECVAPALSQVGAATIWTGQRSWSSALEDHAPVHHFNPETTSLPAGEDDVCIYNLGNNYEFHSAIWRAAMCKPGIVVLHDLYLPGLFSASLMHSSEVQRAVSMTGLQRDELEQAVRWNGREPSPSVQRTYLRLATAGALGVVAHTEEGVNAVRSIGLPVLRAHLPYRSVVHAGPVGRAVRRFRSSFLGQRARTSSRPRVLVIFGHLGPNRRLLSTLQALSCMPERAEFRLHIYGATHMTGQLRGLVRAAGLSRIVHLHGFVPDWELDAALASADLGINLRYPSMGECSLSQLRLWSHATPSVVTQEAWYAELGGDVVEYVRPDHEIQDLQRVFRALIDDPLHFQAQGRRGRERLDLVHAPEKYVGDIVQLASSVRSTPAMSGSDRCYRK